MEIPTIQVFGLTVDHAEPFTINESDFDPKLHRKVVEKLPADFPGSLPLQEAGITKLSQLDGKTETDLKAIKGINATTAKQILAKLAGMQFTES